MDVVKVVVDFDLCEGNGRCAEIAPQVFHLGDDDMLQILDEHPPEKLREALRRACERCPRAAISIDDGGAA
jgi:ferredoxin